jgi:hypothetical protein
MSHFIIDGKNEDDTTVSFLAIGGTNVDLIEGGTNARWDSGT